MGAANLLTVEAQRGTPDSGSRAPLAEVVVDGVGDVQYGGGRMQCNRMLVVP